MSKKYYPILYSKIVYSPIRSLWSEKKPLSIIISETLEKITNKRVVFFVTAPIDTSNDFKKSKFREKKIRPTSKDACL